MDSFGCDVDVSAQTHTQCNRFRNRRKVLRLCECTTKDENEDLEDERMSLNSTLFVMAGDSDAYLYFSREANEKQTEKII